MTLRTGEDTLIWRRRLWIALCGGIVLEEALDLSSDRILKEWMNVVFCSSHRTSKHVEWCSLCGHRYDPMYKKERKKEKMKFEAEPKNGTKEDNNTHTHTHAHEYFMTHLTLGDPNNVSFLFFSFLFFSFLFFYLLFHPTFHRLVGCSRLQTATPTIAIDILTCEKQSVTISVYSLFYALWPRIWNS